VSLFFVSEFTPCVTPATIKLAASGTYDGNTISSFEESKSATTSSVIKVTPLGWSQTSALAGVQATITADASLSELSLKVDADICSGTFSAGIGTVGPYCGSSLLDKLPFTILQETIDISSHGLCNPENPDPSAGGGSGDGDGDGEDEGADVGMIIGIIVGVLALGGGVAFFMMKKKE